MRGARRRASVRVAYVEPGAPAAAAGVGARRPLADDRWRRGGQRQRGRDQRRASRRRAAGEPHRFTFGRRDGSVQHSDAGARPPSPARRCSTSKTIPSASGPVGYLQFNEHTRAGRGAARRRHQPAQGGRRRRPGAGHALQRRRPAGHRQPTGLHGGRPPATQGKTFERLISNRKNPFSFTASQATMPFHANTLGYLRCPPGQPLPQLGLSRVTVLTGPDTCSASESVDQQPARRRREVDLVGGTTCGKPYAFVPKDNCGTTYFAIQFQGVNEQGRADYGDGFAPSCAVADDFDHALGDPAEARLAAALALRAGGACPAACRREPEAGAGSRGSALPAPRAAARDQADRPAAPVMRRRSHVILLAGIVLLGCSALPQADVDSDAPEALRAPLRRRPRPAAGYYARALQTWASPEQVNAWIGQSFEYDMARALRLSESQRLAVRLAADPRAAGVLCEAPGGLCGPGALCGGDAAGHRSVEQGELPHDRVRPAAHSRQHAAPPLGRDPSSAAASAISSPIRNGPAISPAPMAARRTSSATMRAIAPGRSWPFANCPATSAA